VELLDIVRDIRDVGVVVAARGEVDSGTVGTLISELDAAVAEAAAHPAKVLVVELDGVTYFGSAGLNALLLCAERGGADGVAVRLVATKTEVIRPIQVTRLDTVLRPYRSVDEALSPAEPQ